MARGEEGGLVDGRELPFSSLLLLLGCGLNLSSLTDFAWLGLLSSPGGGSSGTAKPLIDNVSAALMSLARSFCATLTYPAYI